MATWPVFVFTAIVLLYLYLQRKFAYWSLRGIPGKNSLYDVLKILYEIFRKPVFEIQLDDYKKFGRIFGTFEGFKPVLFVGEPNLLKNILVKDFYTFRNKTKFDIGEPIFEGMLQLARDDTWKRIRCIMSPTFTSGKMRKMCCLVKECSDNLIKNCQVVAENNQEFDCKPYFGAYALDVVASTAFGTKLNSAMSPNSEFVKKARSVISEDSALLLILITFFPFVLRLLGNSIFKGMMEYFSGVSSKIIEERKKQNIKGYDFLQLMMDAQEGTLEVTEEDIAEMNEEKQVQILPKHKTLTKEEMLSQCVLFLLVGNETTSNTMSFISYCLAVNPDCQDRLLKEIDDAWEKHGEMNFDVVKKLPYLDAVINETLRLYPIASMLIRECDEEYTLGDTGITIHKGCAVHIPIYAMHHDPELFPDPDKFNPDRFLPENKHLIPQYAYLPFGEGPRNCIGMRFALMTIKLAMTHLLHEFRIVATDETKKRLKFYLGQGLFVPKAIIVKMEKRKK